MINLDDVEQELPHTKLMFEPGSLKEDCRKAVLDEGDDTDLLQAKPGICIFTQLSFNKLELARTVQAMRKEVFPLIKNLGKVLNC